MNNNEYLDKKKQFVEIDTTKTLTQQQTITEAEKQRLDQLKSQQFKEWRGLVDARSKQLVNNVAPPGQKPKLKKIGFFKSVGLKLTGNLSDQKRRNQEEYENKLQQYDAQKQAYQDRLDEIELKKEQWIREDISYEGRFGLGEAQELRDQKVNQIDSLFESQGEFKEETMEYSKPEFQARLLDEYEKAKGKSKGEELKSLHSYTGSLSLAQQDEFDSTTMNKALRTGAYGNKDIADSHGDINQLYREQRNMEHIDNCVKVIGNSTLGADTALKTHCNITGLKAMLGMGPDDNLDDSMQKLSSGTHVAIDKSFLSTSVFKNGTASASDADVELRILAHKGTNAIYTPASKQENGFVSDSVVLQAGTPLRVLKVKVEGTGSTKKYIVYTETTKMEALKGNQTVPLMSDHDMRQKLKKPTPNPKKTQKK